MPRALFGSSERAAPARSARGARVRSRALAAALLLGVALPARAAAPLFLTAGVRADLVGLIRRLSGSAP